MTKRVGLDDTPFLLDEIRAALTNHDRSGIRVGRDDQRHDRGIHHSETRDTANPRREKRVLEVDVACVWKGT